MTAPFEPGERALLVDSRGRRYLVRLQARGTFHTHSGAVSHELLLGRGEGVEVRSTTGMVMRAFRPRMADYILKMPRGAQVVYPKDLGPIIVYADLHPGAHVLEAGTGSGALTIALCRAVGEGGRVVSYELRDDFADRGGRNVESFFGKRPGWLELRTGDVRGIADSGEAFHRVVLDLPDPWDVLSHVRPALEPGAILCAYLPTTVQVQQLVLALEGAGFMHLETIETLLRTWHVAERSVRPDHRMVAHTGFVCIGRRLD
jgi:tRNA (adenine57-N1/adenine58-N1)-methyltransferase catalytic subunit